MQPDQIHTPGGPGQTPQQDQSQQPVSVRLNQPQFASDQPFGGNQVQDGYDGTGAPLDAVEWSAAEFVHNEKTAKWYVSLALVTIVAAALIFLVTRDFITVGAIALVSIAFGIVAGRRPRMLQYSVDSSGITISDKHYPLEMFKSFSIIDEGPVSSIDLLPVKRFMPMVSMYYPLEKEEEITNVLGSYLPYEHRESTMIDFVMRRFRF